MKRKCKKCHEIKDISQFERLTDRCIRHECRECVKNRMRQWRIDSIQHIRATRGKYREQNIKRASKWNIEHADKHNAHCLDYYYRKQDIVIKAYGGYVCACCGETEPLFLTIDHINNDGKEHRKRMRGTPIYKWLIDNNFPRGFQVLCMNCNHGKHRNHGICPHKGLSSRLSVTPP